MSLAEKIRASRRVSIPVGKMKFLGRRPTTAEFFQMYKDGAQDVDAVIMLIDGWENVRECDLMKGGSKDLVEFDKVTFAEAIVDLPNIWQPIIEGLIKVTTEHMKLAEANEKN